MRLVGRGVFTRLWRRLRGTRTTAEFLARRDASQPLRLHLGCGRDHWPGWVNVDADPAAGADVTMDFRDIGLAFAPGSVAEVAMVHSLSYLRLWEARDLLTALHRVMGPGAKLVLEFPDAAKCARHLLESNGDPAKALEALRGLYAFGWTAEHLSRELEAVGFSGVTVGEPEHHDRRVWRDTRMEARR